ncbi:MAG: toprim domain-containing protein [Alphaproteobacteria bacterium]
MKARDIIIANGGKWYGCYGMMRCPVHDDRNPSLKVSDGPNGVNVHCFAGCDWQDVRAALGLDSDSPKAVYYQRPASTTGHAEKRRKHSCQATSIWAESVPVGDTPAEVYLRKRGLTGPFQPTSLRFNPGLRHKNGKNYPALVCGITIWPSDTVTAIQRLYLTPHCCKADVDPVRMMLGSVAGGAVRLGPVEDTLIIAEGVETALSVQQALGNSAWAALSANNMERLVLPDLPLARTIIIAADNDESGTGQQAAWNASVKWPDRTVRIMTPSKPGDWNDVLRKGGALQ